MQLENGWIVGVTRVVSPHCDRRPDDEPPAAGHPQHQPAARRIRRPISTSCLPARSIPQHLFRRDPSLRVSAHCLIRRDGRSCSMCPSTSALARGRFSVSGARSVQRFLHRHRAGRHRPVALHQARNTARCRHHRAAGRTLSAAGGQYRRALRYRPGRKTDPRPAFDWDRYLASLEQRDAPADAMLETRKRERNR